MPRSPKNRQSDLPPDHHIPRPPNCFILFRAAYLKSTANSTSREGGRQQQKDVSQDAATAWNALPSADKEHYRVQAEIAKAEHARMYPGWVYKPRMKKKEKITGDCTPMKRKRKISSRQTSSVDAKAERRVVATPFNQDAAPMEMVWDSSWFSGTKFMTDPFYSAPLEPLASVSVSLTHYVEGAHFVHQTSTVPPQMVPTNSYPSFHMAHTRGSGAAPNTMTYIRSPNIGFGNGGSHHPGGHDHNALGPESNPLSFSTGDSTPTLSSSTGEVPALTSEVEPPTHALMHGSGLTWDKLFGSCYYSDDLETNPALNPDFDSFSAMEL